jgi:hypothetical protein
MHGKSMPLVGGAGHDFGPLRAVLDGGGAEPVNGDERDSQCEAQVDLPLVAPGCGRKSRKQLERTAEVADRLGVSGTRDAAYAGEMPEVDGAVEETRFRAVLREDLRPDLEELGLLPLKSVDDAGVERLTLTFQKGRMG